MSAGRFGQTFQVVSSLKYGNQPTITALVCEIADFPRKPGIVLCRQRQLPQGITLVGIEARRDQNEFGIKAEQRCESA